jgi:hypothetical protein
MDGFKKSAKMAHVGHYSWGSKVMKKAKGGIARGEEPMVEQEDIDYVNRQSEKTKKDMGLPVSVYTKGEYDSEASKKMMKNNQTEGTSQRLEDFIKKQKEDSKRIGYDLKVAPSKKSYKTLGEEAKEMKTGGMAKPFWEIKSPKKESKKLTTSQKTSAKARAKKAGRPYPNLVDNAAAARRVK